MVEKLSYKSHWLGKYFGNRFEEIRLEDTGVILISTDQKQTVLDWKDVSSACKLSPSLFFDKVGFEWSGKAISVGWLNQSDALTLSTLFTEKYYTYHSAQAAKALAKISSHLQKIGYLRSSHCITISRFITKALGTIQMPSDEVILPSAIKEIFYELTRWAELDTSMIQGMRSKYVFEQKHCYQKLFDNIESNPLTERQREACIIDEDNNLVLAGAGTGKTSTMVGRVAYLLESKQALGQEILMLAFGNKAAQEMRDRVTEKLGTTAVSAWTFHILGQKIISSVEGEKPSISPLATDEKLLNSHVNQWFSDLLEVPGYKEITLKYFENYLFPEANPFDFKNQGEYYEYIRENEIRTLKGENVKSFEECLIANWLFAMGIEYKYEPSYLESNTRTPDFRQYQPDFYLTEFGIYIEHFGIDRNGNTAPYIDKESYNAGIQWKRQLHSEHSTRLVETYHYEQRERCLLSSLESKLASAGVQFKPLPADAVLHTLREFGAITHFSVLLSSLLKRYRANCYAPGELERLEGYSERAGQLKAAMDLLRPIIERYEALLKSNNEIDFEDMIAKAIGYIDDGSFNSSWSYILVDEFQDISEPRARLVKALRDSRKNSSIFCVGDDWQAIYRFTGSDVGLTTGFESLFGPTQITSLDKTFRFNNSINDVASQFVMKNPSQVKKRITTHTFVQEPAVSLVMKPISNKEVFKHTLEILQKLAVISKQGDTVYLLARYHFRLLESNELAQLKRSVPTLKIEQHSFHASKGKEADYVVILGLDNSKNGFPSRKITDPLLDLLLPKAEPYPDAEERRLFYVAMTRAKHRCYLLTDINKKSDFVKELLKDNYDIELNEFDTEVSQLAVSEYECPSCVSGILVKKKGQYGSFLACTNYPLCAHKESTCPQCNSNMKQSGRYRVCSSDNCDGWIPTCPECHGDLKSRDGRYGKFWGCSSYRSKGPSCGHKEKIISSPSKLRS
ncbi:UvrD-helicase domain-containing protein [Neptunomonas japonica]|uniref:UvrD-helicase domain-containing protein n=1 Tax=Neptunomonas japonica TaxID=417574 RepID=UPI0003FE8932|nr:UvrD-helicase domain-containing protein [Neptunomonas japonica]